MGRVCLMTRSVRYTVQALKKYFEAHLAVKVEDGLIRDLTREGGSTQSPQPHNRPNKLEADVQSRRRWTSSYSAGST